MSTGLEKPRRFKFYIRPTNVIKKRFQMFVIKGS